MSQTKPRRESTGLETSLALLLALVLLVVASWVRPAVASVQTAVPLQTAASLKAASQDHARAAAAQIDIGSPAFSQSKPLGFDGEKEAFQSEVDDDSPKDPSASIDHSQATLPSLETEDNVRRQDQVVFPSDLLNSTGLPRAPPSAR